MNNDIKELLEYIIYLADCNESCVRGNICDIADKYGYVINDNGWTTELVEKEVAQ